MGIGNLGISELLIIFVIVLVFFGPRRLPEVARSLGSAMREFRRSLNQIQREFEEADPRSVLRPDRSVLDRMPESVRPRPPARTGVETTREGAEPPEPSIPGADAGPDTGPAAGPDLEPDAGPDAGPTSEPEPPPAASGRDGPSSAREDPEPRPPTDGGSGSG